jgi:uncharacterized protein
MVENRPFKILSIDGGGIKGLYSATILKRFEEEFGHPISDYFDMICGTSTGGLIAMALSLNISAKEIVDFYKDEGPKIFDSRSFPYSWIRRLRQILWGAKHSNKSLQLALEKVLGKAKMRDAKCLLVIPTFNLTQGRPTVLKSPLRENNPYVNDINKYMVDVALATSAAPTYLPIHKIDNDYFIDGGVWANNPTLCGILEAIDKHLGQEIIVDGKTIVYDRIEILSIASINKSSGWKMGQSKNPSALSLIISEKLINPFMDGSSFFIDFFTEKLASKFSEINYHRIECNRLSIEQENDIDLDKATLNSLKLLESQGNDVGGYYISSKKDKIIHFFNNFKTYKI